MKMWPVFAIFGALFVSVASAAKRYKPVPYLPSADFSSLDEKYGVENVTDFTNLYNAVSGQTNPKTGVALTGTQILLMMSQALQETGLFTASPNFNLINNNNNYAGIKKNSKWPNSTNAFAQYPAIGDFVTDWLRVLNFDFGGGRPIDSVTPGDFVERLKINQYFGTADYPAYKKNVPFYFNLLSSPV